MNKPAEVVPIGKSGTRTANQTVLDNAAHELVFAVVGHVGSGTTTVAEKLQNLLTDKAAIGDSYEVSYIKATTLISEWAERNGEKVPKLKAGEKKSKEYVTQFQNLGDKMRLKDQAAVAKAFCLQIRQERARSQKVKLQPGAAVMPDGVPRAYILDSIRHPAEVQLLRHIYQDAFVLIGVVCESDTREKRLREKYSEAGGNEIVELMARDEKATEKYGQRVSDAFHLADFFVDNTPRRTIDGRANPAWDMAERLSRLIKIIRQADIVRPESGETAMWHAHGAAMRSVCLSRQVGAALIDRHGNLVATGTNEVPRAGGGVYGEGFSTAPNEPDHRCAYREIQDAKPYCSNTKEQNEIVDWLLKSISDIKVLTLEEVEKIRVLLKKGRIGDLLEFSRAVHAEMDAIITASRKEVSTTGTRMFVTTFPCHYCARHIVSAGIDEVQYIEPYPKSKALGLHPDSIQLTAEDWVLPSSGRVTSLLPEDSGRKQSPHPAKVLFRPFTGVAPRLYRRSFLKEGELKNALTGEKEVTPPEWGTPWHLRKLSYAEIEAELAKEE